MNDVESDYLDYENTKQDEGGLHNGGSDPSRGLLLSVSIGVGLLILTIFALWFFR